MPVTICEQGKPDAIVSMKTAFDKLPDETDLFGIATKLLYGDRIPVVLKNGKPAILQMTSQASKTPQEDLFQAREPDPDPNLPVPYSPQPEMLYRFGVECTVLVPFDCTVLHFAPNGLKAEREVEDIMNGKADPRPDMDIIITQDDVERFLTRVEHLQEPCDLGAINCTVHSHKAVMVEGPVS